MTVVATTTTPRYYFIYSALNILTISQYPSPSAQPSNTPSIITTYAGTGATGFSGATISNGPAGIDFDSSGNLYINEYGGHRTLKITIATGIISVFAGTGTPGYSGDGGAATAATFDYPNGLCLDTSGTISLTLCGSLYRFTYLSPLLTY